MNAQNENLIHISIISEKGDTMLDLIPADALAELQRQVHTKGKWLFVDGVHTNVDRLTVADLNPNSEYMLTNLIKGGDRDCTYDQGWDDGFEEGQEEGYLNGYADAEEGEPNIYEAEGGCTCSGCSEECEDNGAENYNGWGNPIRNSTPDVNSGFNANRNCYDPPPRSSIPEMELVFNVGPYEGQLEDLTLCIDVANERVTANLRESVGPIYIRNRELIANVLEQSLNNLAVVEMRNLANKVSSQFDVPNEVIRDFGILTTFEPMDIGTDELDASDLEISIDTVDNTLLIAYNANRRFEILARRAYVVALVRVKLEALSRHYTEKMRTILAV